jgi:hypothetical protein
VAVSVGQAAARAAHLTTKNVNRTGNRLLELVISDLHPRDVALKEMSVPRVQITSYLHQ